MHSHYLELRAIPQIEITEVNVINQVMQSLHQIIVNYQGNIAVSFPLYNVYKTLGGVIRLFGTEDELLKIEADIQRQSSINDYVILMPISKVPFTGKYLRLKRIQGKNQHTLRRTLKRTQERLSAQGKWSEKVKQDIIKKWSHFHLQYPHLHMHSKSSGQKFILWIKQEKCLEPASGIFNSYGLSQTATVPDF
jgi:CRISPR-associated endonuclease Csy4